MPRPMKDSGVEWLGDIPADWTICRLKYCLSTDLQYGANSSGVPFEENLPRYIRITDIISARSLNENNKLSLGLDEASPYLLDDNDILFARSGATVGKAFIYSSNIGQAAFAGYLIRVKTNPLKLLPKFLLLFTQSNAYDEWRNQIFIQSTIQNISAERYNNLPIILPPLDEQQRIATFLDGECARIDSVIENTRASIEEYKKLKQALITRAVTKGIRPNRTLKHSGVEWIGDIPSDWEIIKLKYVADFQPSCDTSNLTDDSEITYTPMECIKNGYFINNTALFGSVAASLTPYNEGDIVMAKVTPCFENGNIAVMKNLSSGFGLGSSELFVFRAHSIETRYLFYWLQNTLFMQQGCATMTGTGGLKRVSPYFVRNSPVTYPDIDEQEEIAQYLDEKTAAIDLLVEKKEQLLTELERLKKSLIFEYVTGKKAVPT